MKKLGILSEYINKSPFIHMVLGFLVYSLGCCMLYELLTPVCWVSFFSGIFVFFGYNMVMRGEDLLLVKMRKRSTASEAVSPPAVDTEEKNEKDN